MSPTRFMEDIVRSTWRHVELIRNSKPRKGKQYVELNEKKRPVRRNIRKSEIPWHVSCVLHEWSHDWGTVSTRDPVKLQCR